MSKIYQIGIDQITTNYFSTYYVVQYNLFKTRDLLRNLIYNFYSKQTEKCKFITRFKYCKDATIFEKKNKHFQPTV